MCHVCCKELKGWCKSFTWTEGLLSILEGILLVVLISFFVFLILHFVACRTQQEGVIEKAPILAFPAPPRNTTTTEVDITRSTLPPDVECTWEPSRPTTARTRHYLPTSDTRSSATDTRTTSTRYTNKFTTTTESLELFGETLEPSHHYDDVEFLEQPDGEPADDTYKSQVVALVKLKPLGDVTFGCILTKITKFWTLTAASCIESIEEVDSLDSFVIMEQWGEAGASRARSVADVRVHPQYRGRRGRARSHDLAALRSHRALRPAAPLRLPRLLDYFLVAVGERFHLLGYGGYRRADAPGAARRLRQVAVFTTGGAACGELTARHLTRGGAAHHSPCGAAPLCAGARWARGAACHYCAGAPLLRAGALFGIMSDNRACALTCEPQLYVNIATVRDWIHSVID